MAGLRMTLLAAVSAVAITVSSAPVHASTTEPAAGVFTLTTAPGILPAWSSEDIELLPIAPAAASTSANDVDTRVTLPVVARTGSAVAVAGGFRLTNTQTNKSVRCQVPTVDARAQAVACVLTDGSEITMFDITAVKSRSRVSTASSTTQVITGMELRLISTTVANLLNSALDTTVFTTSVKVATGDLVVTQDR